MSEEVVLEEGKCYIVGYKLDPKRKNSKLYHAKMQILEIKPVEFERQEIITNHRPWGEGGTGRIYRDQIVEAHEIPRGPVPR